MVMTRANGMMMRQLAQFEPEQIEAFFEKVYQEYGQSFSIENVDGGVVTIELANGKTVKVVI